MDCQCLKVTTTCCALGQKVWPVPSRTHVHRCQSSVNRLNFCVLLFLPFCSMLRAMGRAIQRRLSRWAMLQRLGLLRKEFKHHRAAKTTFRQKDKFPKTQENVAIFDALAQPRTDNAATYILYVWIAKRKAYYYLILFTQSNHTVSTTIVSLPGNSKKETDASRVERQKAKTCCWNLSCRLQTSFVFCRCTSTFRPLLFHTHQNTNQSLGRTWSPAYDSFQVL